MTAFNTQYAFLTASMAAFEADHDPDLMGASHATGPSLVRHWPVHGTELARPWYGTGPSLVRHWPVPGTAHDPDLMGASHAMLRD